MFSILERTPNYRSRVQEAEDWNRQEIEMHGEGMRVAEENRDNPVQDAAAEAERVRKEAEEKEKPREKPKRKSAKRRSMSAEKRKQRKLKRRKRKGSE